MHYHRLACCEDRTCEIGTEKIAVDDVVFAGQSVHLVIVVEKPLRSKRIPDTRFEHGRHEPLVGMVKFEQMPKFMVQYGKQIES